MKSKLLLDANLSWRSVAVLNEHFEACFHVDNIGLPTPASDMEIWKYAELHDLLIVTNDEDFLDLSGINGFPPKVILLKTGNQSRNFIEQTLINTKLQIMDFVISKEYGVLELI